MDWGNCVQNGVATLNCVPIVFQELINAILILAGVIALFMLIAGGIRFITSSGEKEAVESARKMITYAIIGLVIILLSFGIVNILGSLLGVSCISQFGFGNCQ